MSLESVGRFAQPMVDLHSHYLMNLFSSHCQVLLMVFGKASDLNFFHATAKSCITQGQWVFLSHLTCSGWYGKLPLMHIFIRVLSQNFVVFYQVLCNVEFYFLLASSCIIIQNTMLSQHLILHCVQQFSSVLACFDATERWSCLLISRCTS